MDGARKGHPGWQYCKQMAVEGRPNVGVVTVVMMVAGGPPDLRGEVPKADPKGPPGYEDLIRDGGRRPPEIGSTFDDGGPKGPPELVE